VEEERLNLEGSFFLLFLSFYFEHVRCGCRSRGIYKTGLETIRGRWKGGGGKVSA
jgi:hypothetical protein